MLAAYYERNGRAREVLKLGHIETPQPGPGEVRVKLATSGVNPSDVKSRLGVTRKIAYPRVIPHSDGAGERVWVWNAQWRRPFGTCAEYVVLASEQAVLLPANTSFEAGACLGIPAMTAYQAVAVSGAAPGTTPLIAGGAGAVGHYAVQFAKAAGAKVIATISSPQKAEAAHAAGANHAINYKQENVGERVMELTGKTGVDAIIEVDLAANAKLSPHVLRPRGLVVIYGTSNSESEIPWGFFLVNALTLKYVYVYELTAVELRTALDAITRALEDGTLINNVGLTVPLSDIIGAYEMIEQGKVFGNLVVRTDTD